MISKFKLIYVLQGTSILQYSCVMVNVCRCATLTNPTLAAPMPLHWPITFKNLQWINVGVSAWSDHRHNLCAHLNKNHTRITQVIPQGHVGMQYLPRRKVYTAQPPLPHKTGHLHRNARTSHTHRSTTHSHFPKAAQGRIGDDEKRIYSVKPETVQPSILLSSSQQMTVCGVYAERKKELKLKTSFQQHKDAWRKHLEKTTGWGQGIHNAGGCLCTSVPT